jgi:PQQ-like domain
VAPGDRQLRTQTLLLVIVVTASAGSARLLADRPAGGWPGWRGGAAEGRVSGPLPTASSGVAGIRWKTPIPGRGYSSPIVFGGRVYITTADATVSGARLQTSLRWLTIALAFLVIRFSLGRAVSCCLPQHTPSPMTFLTSALAVALSVAIGAITSAGDGLFGCRTTRHADG